MTETGMLAITPGLRVLVTAGAAGIGRAIADTFADNGARVHICDIDEVALASYRAERPDHGASPCDVADDRQVDRLFAAAKDRLGGLDVLVNNAGLTRDGLAVRTKDADWRRVLDINLTAPFQLTRSLLRPMMKRRWGRIVNITSMADTHTGATQVDYAAAKSGLRMMTVGFCIALGKHGIPVNAVAPGHVLTDMTKHHWAKPEPAKYIKGRVPVGRIGTPKDIGHACVFLASQEAAYISGTTVRVDGGYIASNG